MAESPETPRTQQAEDAPAPKRKLVPVLVLVVCLVVGGGAGFVGVGAMTGGAAGAPAESAASAEAAPADLPLYVVDNLVVNPAGTNGARFLIVTVALEGGSAAAMDAMKKSDAQLRDAFLRVLGMKTVEELADMGQRDSLKAELLRTAVATIGEQDIRQIYFPQFVLQ